MLHQKIVYSLWPKPLLFGSIIVPDYRQLADDAALQTGLFLYLAQSSLFEGFTGLEFALWKRQVIVSRPMHKQHATWAAVAVNYQASCCEFFGSHQRKTTA